MAKIFLSFMNGMRQDGDPTAVPAYYESFIRGLADCGNDLMVFHAFGQPYGERPKLTEAVRKAVGEFAPELIIAFNNFGPDYASFCDCPIAIYEVDTPLVYDWKDRIRAQPDRYRYFVVQEKDRVVLRERFGVEDRHIADAPFFTEVRAEELAKTRNISFIGSRFAQGKFHWNRFRHRADAPQDFDAYRRLLEAIRTDPFRPPQDLLAEFPTLGLKADDVYDLIGDLSAERRIQVLSAVADLGLSLFGNRAWLEAEGECSDLYLAYDPQTVFSLRHNQDIYNSSKVCLNVNHLQAVDAFSWRVCDIMASSGCLVTEDRPYLAKYFPGVPIPTFRNRYEAREQCLRILGDGHLREDTVAACQEAVNAKFRFANILPILEGLLGRSLRGDARPDAVSFVNCAGIAGVAAKEPVRRRNGRMDVFRYGLQLAAASLAAPAKVPKVLEKLTRR